MSYILAWNPDVDASDTEGLRPLHLAVRVSEDIRSTRSIKHLLIRGASRNVKDSTGKTPLDYAQQIKNP